MVVQGISYIKNPTNGDPLQAVIDLRVHRAAYLRFLAEVSPEALAAFTGKPATPAATTPISNAPAVPANLAAQLDKVIETARQFMGTPHVIGGTDRNGIDCSGLTMTAFLAIGLALPRVSRQQADIGTALERNQLRKGDLVFFATGAPGRINHVGVVSNVQADGKVNFIHASTSKGVIEASLSDNYWNQTYMAGRRVLMS